MAESETDNLFYVALLRYTYVAMYSKYIILYLFCILARLHNIEESILLKNECVKYNIWLQH